MADENRKTVIVDPRPNPQRLKRVHPDTSRDSDENDPPSLESLRARVTGLTAVHQRLRETLSKPVKAHGEELCREFEEARSNDCAGADLPTTAWTDALLEAVFEKAHSDSEANSPGKILYHIDQKTIFLLSNGRVGIQFDPTYLGLPQEKYYCVLTTKPPSEKVSISKDNFPFFLNIRELEKMHLPTSAAKLIDHIHNSLQAYVCRREQMNRLRELHGDILGGFYHSLPYNFIDFYLEEGNSKIEVNIVYENLESERPTRSRVTVWFGGIRQSTALRGVQSAQVESRTLFRAEEAVRAKPFPEALDDLIREIKVALEDLSNPQTV